jgi:rhomboid family GlyGly-CTERM serine protease
VAGGIRLNGRPAWLGLCALLLAGSLLGWFVPAPFWDWQPGRAASEPWRAWTAAFVHWSPLHLGGNLAATALVAVFGSTAQVPARTALAWALAWPLGHAGLLLQPALLHYGGLSGVLHAGVAVVLVQLLLEGAGRRRVIGAMVSVGLVVKLWLEAPWGPPLRQVPGWDIAIAPLAHLTGTLAGVLAALGVAAAARCLRPPQSAR